jgi:hypothetical protein
MASVFRGVADILIRVCAQPGVQARKMPVNGRLYGLIAHSAC